MKEYIDKQQAIELMRKEAAAWDNMDECTAHVYRNAAKALETLPNADIFDRIAHYEDLEEKGRLKEVVCDVGDTVWDKEVEPWDVISIEWFSRKVTHLHCVSPVTGIRRTFAVGKRSLGKTVFLFRTEAEKSLGGNK